MMNKYEVMFILNPELSEEDTQSVIVKFVAACILFRDTFGRCMFRKRSIRIGT